MVSNGMLHVHIYNYTNKFNVKVLRPGASILNSDEGLPRKSRFSSGPILPQRYLCTNLLSRHYPVIDLFRLFILHRNEPVILILLICSLKGGSRQKSFVKKRNANYVLTYNFTLRHTKYSNEQIIIVFT